MRVILCFLMFGLCSMYATLTDYQFGYSETVWQELSGANSLGNEQTNDQCFINPEYPLGISSSTGVGLPIGFDFIFDGNTYDRFGICADGWLGLGKSIYGNQAVMLSLTNNSYPPLNHTYPSGASEDRIARIAGFGRDLQAQSGASLKYATLGMAPQRILVVEWKNYRRFNLSGDSLNFQIRLYESSKKIEIIFGQMQVATACSAQIGMRSLPSNEAVSFACRTTAGGYSNSIAGTSASVQATLSSTIKPVIGAVFSWTPAASLSADFTALPLSGFAPLAVQYQDQSQTGGGAIQTWNWSFGDGSSSNVQNPTHSYYSPGVYTVSLTVHDGVSSNQRTKTNYIQVYERPFGPALNMTMQGYDAHLNWEHITTDTQGYPLQPTFYYLYFNGSADPDGDFYFLAPIPYPAHSYIHQGVGRGANHMFYKIKAVDNP